MADQRKLLESRYDLTPRPDPTVKMARGKPICVGPTARLSEGVTFEALANAAPAEIKQKNQFPYPSLPHPLHTNGGQVFPPMQIEMFPRLQRFDVDFDLPEAFLPEFPPAIFLQNRPELGGRVPRPGRVPGELPHAVQGHPDAGPARRDADAPDPAAAGGVQPDGRPEVAAAADGGGLLRLPRERAHDRAVPPEPGPPAAGAAVPARHDEFEQRTAYFNGDAIRAMKKGFQEIPRGLVPHMAQAQNMFDFPPAPKLGLTGRLDPAKATESEVRGEKLFFGKAQCATCHPAPFYTDHLMHDLKLERFLNEPGDGPIKSFTLRGIKESPPYLHDGRCLTLEDTVEFFNLVLGLKLTKEEKADLVAFLRCL
jgi:hypothetical protein